MVAARINFGFTLGSTFADGYTIFFFWYSSTIGAETVLPWRSLKTNCDLNLRFSVFAAEAETAMAQAEIAVSRRVIFRTGTPPMHSIGASRKRFFTNFPIKRNPPETRPSLAKQVAIP